MKIYSVVFPIAAICSLISAFVLRWICGKKGWFDYPNKEKNIHSSPIPRLGGISIYFSLISGLSIGFCFEAPSSQLLMLWTGKLIQIFLPATFVFFVGVCDDFYPLKAWIKLTVQISAGVTFFLFKEQNFLLLPFTFNNHFPIFLDFFVTISWITIISNAFNLIDGVDGLASGIAFFASMILLANSIILGEAFTSLILIALLGSLTGFLPFNFHPASMFLGDSGALFIGFVLASVSIPNITADSMPAKLVVSAFAFSVPIIEIVVTILRRLFTRKPLFIGDQKHIHHKLLKYGWSQKQIVLFLCAICLFLGVLAMFVIYGSSA